MRLIDFKPEIQDVADLHKTVRFQDGFFKKKLCLTFFPKVIPIIRA